MKLEQIPDTSEESEAKKIAREERCRKEREYRNDLYKRKGFNNRKEYRDDLAKRRTWKIDSANA